MEGEPSEPTNLLVLGENNTFQKNFIEDLVRFLKGVDYDPANDVNRVGCKSTFKALYREFCIISGPTLSGNDSAVEVSSKFSRIQFDFFQPQNLNAIIFLLPPYPLQYEQFLSLHLFTNFCKEDMAMIEKKVMFVFVHDEPVSYQKSCVVDADLWTVLDRLGADLLNSKTLHCPARLTKDFCHIFLQFINKNKKSLMVQIGSSHESVLKAVGNEEFLEIIIEAACVNEDNIFYKASGKNQQNYFEVGHSYKTMCKSQKCLKVCCPLCNFHRYQKHDLGICNVLENRITCRNCKCSISDHKSVKYQINKTESIDQSTEQQKSYRQTFVTIMLTIDLFLKEHDASVGQLYDRLKEKVKQEPRYSVLETMYEYEMGRCQKEITSDVCLESLRKLFPSLRDLASIDQYFTRSLLESRGNLRVKC